VRLPEQLVHFDVGKIEQCGKLAGKRGLSASGRADYVDALESAELFEVHGC
jgi:hypothetical protein